MKGSRIMLVSLTLALGGCDMGADTSDLQTYMAEVRARPIAPIEPIPAFQPYEAFTYGASGLRSPFQPPSKIEIERKVKGVVSDVKPDETRPRQFLEGFDMDTFSMVGTLSNAGRLYALVNGAGGVYRVQKGDYMGRNHGHIVSISEDHIELVEIVPDGDGGWMERPRTLTLKEAAADDKKPAAGRKKS